MATIPYQSTYGLQFKHGTRYGPSQFGPTQTAAGSPQTLGVTQPATTTVGAGTPGSAAVQTATGQQPAMQTLGQQIQTDPLSNMPGVGFRPLPGSAYPPAGTPPGQTPPTVPGVPPNQAPADPTVTAMVNADGGDDWNYQADKIPAANTLGYTRGTQNPLGFVAGFPYIGGYLADQLPDSPKYDYGTFGTYDAEGNVFGNEGRAYDPITGAAAQSYAKPSDWYGSYLGIGTEDGFLGPSSSYGKLRAAGENIPSSFLGSYENSVYNVPRSARVAGYSPAEFAGLSTMTQRARRNQEILAQAGLGFDQEPELMDALEDITAKDLGFTDARPMPSAPSAGTYAYGTQTGDVFTTPGSYQTGVINESGQIETPTGTVVQTQDAYGNTVSLLGSPEENKQALQNVKDSFNYSDGLGLNDWGDNSNEDSNDSGSSVGGSDDFGDYGDSFNDTTEVDDSGWGGGWWSKGGKIPSTQAGGK